MSKPRIVVAGDIHGRPDILYEILLSLSPGDTLIIVGDFGKGFFWEYCDEEKYLDYISSMEITIIFVDGNHENFMDLNSLPVVKWCGARVHMLRHNIIHVLRGEVLEIEGVKIFMFGGGYSIDRARRREGIDWWPEEMISDTDIENAEHNLNKCARVVDYCITHSAPINTVKLLAQRFSHIKGDVIEEQKLTNYLQWVAESVSYGKWFFGHFHLDVTESELWPGQFALMNNVRDLESGEVVYTRTRIHNSPDRIVYIKDEWI